METICRSRNSHKNNLQPPHRMHMLDRVKKISVTGTFSFCSRFSSCRNFQINREPRPGWARLFFTFLESLKWTDFGTLFWYQDAWWDLQRKRGRQNLIKAWSFGIFVLLWSVLLLLNPTLWQIWEVNRTLVAAEIWLKLEIGWNWMKLVRFTT